MQNIKFRPIEPYDVPILQAVIQDTDFNYLSFNRYAQSIFIATYNGNIIGFTFGQKGYSETSHVLTICGTYFRAAYDDENHDHELHVAFINWAEKALQVTHYQLGEYGHITPINVPLYDSLPILQTQSQLPEPVLV